MLKRLAGNLRGTGLVERFGPFHTTDNPLSTKATALEQCCRKENSKLPMLAMAFFRGSCATIAHAIYGSLAGDVYTKKTRVTKAVDIPPIFNVNPAFQEASANHRLRHTLKFECALATMQASDIAVVAMDAAVSVLRR